MSHDLQRRVMRLHQRLASPQDKREHHLRDGLRALSDADLAELRCMAEDDNGPEDEITAWLHAHGIDATMDAGK